MEDNTSRQEVKVRGSADFLRMRRVSPFALVKNMHRSQTGLSIGLTRASGKTHGDDGGEDYDN